MTHKERSNRTKKALSDSLKRRMETTSVSKITIRELVEDCDLDRKTFYYHFPDIYALLVWTIQQEAFGMMSQFDMLIDEQDAMEFTFRYVRDNRKMLSCCLESVGREELKHFFYQDLYELTRHTVEHQAKLLPCEFPQSYMDFLMQMYTEALGGTVITLIQMKENDPKWSRMQEYISIALPASIRGSLMAATQRLSDSND